MRKVILFLAASTLAQETTFVVDTKVVVVNVTVKDKAGRPITNLKKEDFRVFEDNAAQTMDSFELQELSGEPLAPLSFTGASQTIETRAAANAPVAANTPVA